VLSSRDAQAVIQLRHAVLLAVRGSHTQREVFVPYERTELLQTIYARCRVREARASPRGTQLLLEGEPHVVEAIARACRSRTP
jgi:hypothetical protein